MERIIMASTSTVHGSGYLEYLLPELNLFFKGVNTILFVPYARPGGISYSQYTSIAKAGLAKIKKEVVGIHEYKNPIEAINNAEAIFIGGGNTFVLTHQLYKNKLIETLQAKVKSGTPYLGTSAGSNICGLTIKTTNDMPIVYPPSFNGLGLVPFNINPHYIDPDPKSTHMGETRETRIKEFHQYNTFPVVGLREGSWLHVTGNAITLKGNLLARIFEYNKEPYEIEMGTGLGYLK
ncbi:MAG: dipeptidase PepE [Aestuariibaculum sp.]